MEIKLSYDAIMNIKVGLNELIRVYVERSEKVKEVDNQSYSFWMNEIQGLKDAYKELTGIDQFL